jgi:hypothetical protein
MPAAQYDFEVEQGATLLKAFVWKDSQGVPVDVTGYTAKMQVRSSALSDTVLLELSTANQRIVLGGPQGLITMVFAPATTTGLAWRRGKYDLELTSPNGTVTRFLAGQLSLVREITRE